MGDPILNPGKKKERLSGQFHDYTVWIRSAHFLFVNKTTGFFLVPKMSPKDLMPESLVFYRDCPNMDVDTLLFLALHEFLSFLRIADRHNLYGKKILLRGSFHFPGRNRFLCYYLFLPRFCGLLGLYRLEFFRRDGRRN